MSQQRDTFDALLELHERGELVPLLTEAFDEAVTVVREDYLPIYLAVTTVAVTVELLLVGALLWWAYRSDRLTAKWRRRLLAALPVAVLFGGVRLALSPSVLGGLWLAGVAAAWVLVVARVPAVDDPEPADDDYVQVPAP